MMKIYPNPVRSELTIETSLKTSVQLINTTESIMDVPCAETSQAKKLSLSGIPAGIYLLIIQSEASKTYFKIVKPE